VSWAVDVALELSGVECPLLALENVEVVVGPEATRVPLGADRCAEHDEVLGHGGVKEGHRTHRAAGVVEDPLVVGLDVAGPARRQSVDERRESVTNWSAHDAPDDVV